MARMKNSFLVQELTDHADWCDWEERFSNAQEARRAILTIGEPNQSYRIISLRSNILTVRTEQVRKVEEVTE